MIRFVVRRVLISLPLVGLVLFFGFVLLQIVPSDPAVLIAGESATPDTVAAIRRQLGLDKPVAWQFLIYLERLASGDLGRSLVTNVPVAVELRHTIGPTLELLLGSMLWGAPLGICLGTVAALRRGQAADRLLMVLAVAGLSMPVFTLGLVLIEFVGFRLELLPVEGRGGPVWTLDGLRHLVLPSLTLGAVLMGPVARMTRTTLLEVLSQDFIRTARAKGLPKRVVNLRHGLRNALIPVVTLIGLQAGYMLGGAVVTEMLFSWPGVGRLAVGAITGGDVVLAQGAILVLALSFIAINLAVDVLYAVLDPRTRRP
jgi:ABC-type dipeptide/oligopeptide/nickel transport system permease component